MRTPSVSVPFALLSAALFTLAPRPLTAQAHDHDHEPAEHEHGGLHFSHPLISESVSPDTKLRLDYSRTDEGGAGEIELEGEYAFHPSFSIEVAVPFDLEGGDVRESEIAFRFANYAFAEHGVLLGYGLGVGLPTGSEKEEEEDDVVPLPGDVGVEEHDDVYELEPFLNAGVMAGRWELVGFTRFAIPTARDLPEDEAPRLLFNGSALRHFTSRIEGLLEVDGGTGLSGEARDRTVVNLSPGVKVRPAAGSKLIFGAAVSLPLTSEREFDSRVQASGFWHF